MTFLVALLLAQPPFPTSFTARQGTGMGHSADGGNAWAVECSNCSGGGGVAGGLTDTQLRASPVPVYVQDAGVINVNPVAISSAPTLNVGDAGVLNVNPLSATVTNQLTASITDAGVLNVNPITVANAITVSLTDAGVLNVNSHPVTQGTSPWVVSLNGPVTIADAGVLNINSPAVTQGGIWTVHVADAGVLNVNPISITNALTASITDAGVLNVNFPATQAVSIAGSNPCNYAGATLTAVAGATSGTIAVQLVGLSGTTKIYLCSVNVTGVSGTTPTFSLKYGTGTACATGGVTILGAWTTAANTVYTFYQPFVTPAGQELCYLDTGTSPVQNYAISYVQQ